jgi:hypothetical protein
VSRGMTEASSSSSSRHQRVNPASVPVRGCVHEGGGRAFTRYAVLGREKFLMVIGYGSQDLICFYSLMVSNIRSVALRLRPSWSASALVTHHRKGGIAKCARLRGARVLGG